MVQSTAEARAALVIKQSGQPHRTSWTMVQSDVLNNLWCLPLEPDWRTISIITPRISQSLSVSLRFVFVVLIERQLSKASLESCFHIIYCTIIHEHPAWYLSECYRVLAVHRIPRLSHHN